MSKKRNKIAMIVFSHYPEDPRVRREAEALEEKGYSIDIYCLKRGNQVSKEKMGNVFVLRSSLNRSRSSKLNYIFEYLIFILVMFFKISFKFFIKKYDIVHVHNMPDILIFTSIIPKLFGAKLILDLHDPTPEVFMTKYNIDKDHRMIKFLISLEKLSIKFANKVITPNIAFKDLFVSRGCPEEKINIIMNSPHEGIFKILSKKPIQNKKTFSIIYHGSIVERHGLYDALLAIKSLRNKIQNIVFNVYGEGDYKDQLVLDINKLSLNDVVFFRGFYSQEKLVDEIYKADLGIIPNRKSPFTEINLPTRIFEYLRLEKPVIVPKTKGILDYFDESSLLFFNSGDPDDLASKIFEVYKSPDECMKKIKKGIKIYNKFTWASQKKELINIMYSLLNN